MQRPSAEGVEEGDDAVKYDAMSSQAVLPIPPGTSEPMQPEQDKKLLPRSFGSAVLQTLPMLVLAAAGLLLSGRELDRVSVSVHRSPQHWNVFQAVDKFLVLVPIMFNLKGNLELNLSLRMSTASNMSELDSRRTRQTLVRGNLALLQAQALIIACVAGALSFVLGHDWNSKAAALAAAPSADAGATALSAASNATASALAPRGIHNPNRPNVNRALRLRNGYLEFFMIVAVAMMSASLSSAAQGTCLCALVIWSRRFNIDPDQSVVPIAGSLGDLVTLTILGVLAAGMFPTEGSLLSLALFVVLIGICCVMVIMTLRNVYVRELFGEGWVPLIVAAVVSSVAGLLLDRNADRYDGLALLAPVVSGLPGVAAAILSSTLSSGLHTGHIVAPTRSALGTYAPIHEADGEARADTEPTAPGARGWLVPLCGWQMPLALLASTIVVQVSYLFFLWATRSLVFGWQFAVCFTSLSMLLVCVALALGYTLCLLLWYFDYDPDMSCMPYVTSLVDALSQLVLFAAFAAAHALGDRVST